MMKFGIKILAIAIGGLAFPSCATANVCAGLSHLVGAAGDASAALIDCIKKTPPGGKLELPAGKLLVKRQLVFGAPISVTTAGVPDSAPPCSTLGATRCAVIVMDASSSSHPRTMPIEINANDVTLTHLIIEGANDPALIADCSPPDRRNYAGGFRVRASRFVLRKSILRNFACHTAMQVKAGYGGLTIEDNLIGPNGNHSAYGLWSDGITVHDSNGAIVRRNVFIDNTDVQLVLAGCASCRIESNEFRHSGSFSRSSFAELMLNTFPGTSGSFAGTTVSGNRIDCTAARRCGYGIMIGSNPWLAKKGSSRSGGMSGGTITRNLVRNAPMAINIDAATGPVQVSANQVEASGGQRGSDCGQRNWPAVNVAPEAVRFVRGDPSNLAEGHVSTTGCLINRRAG